MEGDDVLAAGRRAERRDEVVAEILQHKERSGADREHEAERGEHRHADSAQHDTDEHQHVEHRGHGPAEGLRVDLLDAGLDVVLPHEVSDDVRRLKLLLAPGRADAHLLVEVIKIVMCHGHCEGPLEESREQSSS